jgi:Fe-S oxidoreductase
MLSTPEKLFFISLTIIVMVPAVSIARRIVLILRQGSGNPDWTAVPSRLLKVTINITTLWPTFNLRLFPSLLHGLVAWGFMYFLLVNIIDILEAFVKDYEFLRWAFFGDLFRFGADIFSAAVLLGMAALLARRFIFKSPELSSRSDVLLFPNARKSIKRDSAIVGIFILIHVGARLVGQSFKIAAEGIDPWQVFASSISPIWGSLDSTALTLAEHTAFWIAMGSILLFIPYFLYSKHIHIFFAPLNHLLKPDRRSIGELSRIDFEDESIEQFGVSHIEELSWEQLMDSYACIMCNRCQDECPAYETGKVLSPAALEINKRYYLNHAGDDIAHGKQGSDPLTSFAIPEEAVWACTACGACIQICPVNNEPMRDIMDIRRSLVLMDNNFPAQLQNVYRGLERNANPWNIPSDQRIKWADGLQVPTIDQYPDPDILWWVGCAPAIDARAQETARAFAKILNIAEINYAILGEKEGCTGDSARRSGNEYLFQELALSNIVTLNEIAPKQIVTTCPHCLHTLKNEYPAFGGDFKVIHHTELIADLLDSGRITPQNCRSQTITFHDPCYLSRHNQITEDPRCVLAAVSDKLIEMPRHLKKAFCCGAGGAQMWKEEQDGDERINANRFREAESTCADTIAVGCPFCLMMLTDAAGDANSEMQVEDIAEIIAALL